MQATDEVPQMKTVLPLCQGGDALVLCTLISPFTYLLKTQIANAIVLSETGGVGVGTLEDLSRGYSIK